MKNFSMLFGGNAKKHKKLGNDAMRQKKWLEAQLSYETYLSSNPKDFSTWVQIGHAYKEQEKHDLAEQAYLTAQKLNQNDADLYLQIGHLKKITGYKTEALAAYKKSYEINPTYLSEVEIKGLIDNPNEFNKNIAPAKPSVGNIVYVELDDMLIYLEAHRTVSGIQRVQVEFARYVIENGCVLDGLTFVFVSNPPYQNCIWQLDSHAVMEIVTYANSPNSDHEHLKKLVISARQNAKRIIPTAGQHYLVLGAFWVFDTVSGRFMHLKQAGIKIGGFIHDLIPINQPEYCVKELCHEFLLSFGDSMQMFDFILTNSQYTADEVINYRKKLGLPPMPVKAVPLAHANKIISDQEDPWTDNIKHLKGKRFAMMVSTIEARKNHTYLVNAWRQFYNEGLNPPDLVFVGRFGWRVHDLMNTLEQSNNFDGRLHVLHGLTDSELNKLYKECEFTLFPSYVEGWGLPVGESLAHGKPCISSMTSAMPEVGGEFVDYVDPLNLRDGITVLKQMCFDSEYRISREKNIKDHFSPRTWDDFSRNLVTHITEQYHSKNPNKIFQANFPPGIIFRPNQLAFGKKLPLDYPVNPLRLLLTWSWSVVEHWGAWLLGNHAEIEFRSPYTEGEVISLYLELLSAPFAHPDNYVTLTVNDNTPANELDASHKWAQIEPNKTFIVRASGKVGKNGIVHINILIKGDLQYENDSPNARKFVIGIKSLAYAKDNDLACRCAITEKFTNTISIV